MKKQMKWLMLQGVVLVSMSVFASKTFNFPSGKTEGYWNDSSCWSGDGSDRECYSAGTLYITNNCGSPVWIKFGSQSGTILRFLAPDGQLNSELRPGNRQNELGIADIQEGATFTGAIIAGGGGFGVVTNSGTWNKSGALQLGTGATGHGIMYQNGTVVNSAPKEMHIGEKGWGELFVNKPFSWTFNKHGDGDIIVGQSQHTNRIVISEDGGLSAHYVYLGGRIAGQAGHGELQLRGGYYNNNRDNGSKEDLFYLGACPNSDGNGVDTLSYGAIRGWGSFRGNDNSRRYDRGVYIRLGYGEIMADGDGDEANVLSCLTGMYQVTNALPGGITESGWRAVNKGMVVYPRNLQWGWDVVATNVCVGCSAFLEKPDLVNAVKISAKGLPSSTDKTFGAALLALDRTDAHTNLFESVVVNTLSVHRLGIFGGRDSTSAAVAAGSFRASFRYDQTKLFYSDTRLELMRYTESSGTWKRLKRLEPGERPDDCILSMDEYISASDTSGEEYTLGTFAVVETKKSGFTLIIK